jgi:hypothetical protein
MLDAFDFAAGHMISKDLKKRPDDLLRIETASTGQLGRLNPQRPKS